MLDFNNFLSTIKKLSLKNSPISIQEVEKIVAYDSKDLVAKYFDKAIKIGFIHKSTTGFLWCEKDEIVKNTNIYTNNIKHMFSIGSTNKELMTEKNIHNKMLISENQNFGIGRNGKRWESPPFCNIYCSYGIEIDIENTEEINKISAMGLVVGTIVLEVLEKIYNIENIQLKWPNDIIYNNKKLAGILITNSISAKKCKIVIGIGLNCLKPKSHLENKIDISQPWICLEQITNKKIERKKIIKELHKALKANLEVFIKHGFIEFIARWRKYDYFENSIIEITTEKGKFEGEYKGITSSGKMKFCDKNNNMIIFDNRISCKLLHKIQ
jgi:BirA family biotin operon repressor/biotin-[acetyl-CoA-carboxylase] ligase